jgi:putative flavoprotein involved in K+ transport
VDLESAEIVIIGGGQAGLALSYHLTALGRPHAILEQGRIVESWRTKRWDSLRLIAPNWSLLLPGFAYRGDDPDGFMTKDEVVEHLVGYARSFGAPVQEGVRVVSVEADRTDGKLRVRTEGGELKTATVAVATGALQRPRVPDFAAAIPTSVVQLVPSEYHNPAALPPGKVLVVGSGQSGCQIAEELSRAGRDVFLSAGRSWWAPRRYRGRDISAWLRLMGWFERLAADLPRGVRAGKPNPQLTGADGGHDISPHTLARDGVVLLGRLNGISDRTAYFAADLAANIAWADEQALDLLRTIDRFADDLGPDVPPADMPADLARVKSRDRASARFDVGRASPELHLSAEGVASVIWATSYRPDLDWVHLPFLDENGYPIHRHGVTPVAGLYIVGLDWLHTAKSGLFAGVGDDAGYIASVIAASR